MAKTFTIQDFERLFPDDDACLAHLMVLRFGTRFVCPKCNREATFYRRVKRPAFTCEWCGHDINPMVGTPFERTHTALRKWFYAMYLFTTSRHGVPAKELQRQLGVTYKTAWRMGHEIRKYMAAVDGDDNLDGHVEIDETVIGGVRRGGKRGRGSPGKTIVFGMLERSGKIMSRVVANVRRATIHPIILENVKAGAAISTDELNTYASLGTYGYQHSVVLHSAKEWARSAVHINGLEGYWAQLKRSIRGTHIHVSAKHLPKYLGEFEYRYNLRKHAELMFPRLLASF